MKRFFKKLALAPLVLIIGLVALITQVLMVLLTATSAGFSAFLSTAIDLTIDFLSGWSVRVKHFLRS